MQALSDAGERRVAHRVAEDVVHALEAIEVDERDREPALVATSARDEARELAGQELPVVQTGDLVDERQVGQLHRPFAQHLAELLALSRRTHAGDELGVVVEVAQDVVGAEPQRLERFVELEVRVHDDHGDACEVGILL